MDLGWGHMPPCFPRGYATAVDWQLLPMTIVSSEEHLHSLLTVCIVCLCELFDVVLIHLFYFYIISASRSTIISTCSRGIRYFMVDCRSVCMLPGNTDECACRSVWPFWSKSNIPACSYFVDMLSTPVCYGTDRVEWMMGYQGMVCLATNQVWWTWEVEDVFRKVQIGLKQAMKEYAKKQHRQIDDLVVQVCVHQLCWLFVILLLIIIINFCVL